MVIGSVRQSLLVESLLGVLLGLPLIYISWVTAVSFWLGVAICLVPIGVFAHVFLREGSARSLTWAFYWGELFKLFTTVGLFVIVFHWASLRPGALFVGVFVQYVIHSILLGKFFKK